MLLAVHHEARLRGMHAGAIAAAHRVQRASREQLRQRALEEEAKKQLEARESLRRGLRSHSAPRARTAAA